MGFIGSGRGRETNQEKEKLDAVKQYNNNY